MGLFLYDFFGIIKAMIQKKKPIKNKKKSVRLASHIYPTKYDLTLKSDLEAWVFSGSEVIDIVVDKPTNEIALHSKDLEIETAEIIIGKQKEFAVKISYNTKAETATFTFKNKIPKGKAKLSIVFSGIISDGLRGFYRSHYTEDGVKKKIATTQFEATDARRAFPCFDEPAHKAEFHVSLIVPNSYTAISNTLPTKIAEHEAGYQIINFEKTPRMSTYLLAFIIGEFEFIEGLTKDKVRVRVFTTKGKKHQAKFALDVAIRSLEFYNNYFGVPYPLPILDLIALPDFESAAMENWGAVTFRETAVLVDDEHTSFANKQWVAIVIAHEIAHQWFGNLVTMHWWTDLWLNEGFASYMEHFCVDHLFPEWKVWDLYLSDRYAVALRLDALAGSHPIEVEVHHPSEINEIFDAVSYAKGSAVIRMLAVYLGKDKFKEGLQYYMKKHKYENTHTVDLWSAFEKVSKKPVKKIMQNWTGKMGYPLLTIKNNKKGFSIEQERFFSSRISKKTNKENTLWQVPIKYESLNTQTGNSERLSVLLTKKSAPLIGTSVGKVNAGESTLARVLYDEVTLHKVAEEINNGKLRSHDRLGIIRDLFALAEGGYIGATVALEFALNFRNETEYIVWAELTSGIDRVHHIIADDKATKELYHKYAKQIFSPLAQKMGFEKIKGEEHSHTFLRNLALSHAAFYGDIDIKNNAIKIFREKTILPADIRSIVYSIVARNGGTKEWETFEKMYTTATLDEERDRVGRALAQFTDKTLLARTLTFTLSKAVRTQDAPFMIGAVWQNTDGRDLTWKFVKHNYKKLLATYGEGGHFLGRLLSPLGTHTKESDAKQIKEFFKKNVAPGAERTITQSIEKILSNASWIKADLKDIKKWLTKNYK